MASDGSVSRCLRRSGKEPSEFAHVFEAEFRPITVFITRRVFEVETAVDLAAETMAQAFLSRRRFRGTTDAEARAWLLAIARHQLSRYFRRGYAESRALRRLGVEAPEPAPEEISRIAELAGTEDLRAAVREGLAELSAAQRDALQLRVVEERSYGETAAALGVSEQVARARVSRGLKALSVALDRTLVDEVSG